MNTPEQNTAVSLIPGIPSPARLLLPASYSIATDGLVTLSMTEPQFLEWLQQFAIMRGDMKMLRDNIVKLLKQVKFLNEDGTPNEKFKPSSMLSLLSLLTNEKKVAEHFGWLGELAPMIVRYKNL